MDIDADLLKIDDIDLDSLLKDANEATHSVEEELLSALKVEKAESEEKRPEITLGLQEFDIIDIKPQKPQKTAIYEKGTSTDPAITKEQDLFINEKYFNPRSPSIHAESADSKEDEYETKSYEGETSEEHEIIPLLSEEDLRHPLDSMIPTSPRKHDRSSVSSDIPFEDTARYLKAIPPLIPQEDIGHSYELFDLADKSRRVSCVSFCDRGVAVAVVGITEKEGRWRSGDRIDPKERSVYIVPTHPLPSSHMFEELEGDMDISAIIHSLPTPDICTCSSKHVIQYISPFPLTTLTAENRFLYCGCINGEVVVFDMMSQLVQPSKFSSFSHHGVGPVCYLGLDDDQITAVCTDCSVIVFNKTRFPAPVSINNIDSTETIPHVLSSASILITGTLLLSEEICQKQSILKEDQSKAHFLYRNHPSLHDRFDERTNKAEVVCGTVDG
ncbi:hypothetical protein ADUPG1_000691, partial [Aduncisulcus paluster]